jgi:hypothetical protein
MGIWSGNASFGNIVGTAIVALLYSLYQEKEKSTAWKLSFIIVGLLVAFHAVLMWQYLKPAPAKTKYEPPRPLLSPATVVFDDSDDISQHSLLTKMDRDSKSGAERGHLIRGDVDTYVDDDFDAATIHDDNQTSNHPAHISFWKAWLIPGVRRILSNYDEKRGKNSSEGFV